MPNPANDDRPEMADPPVTWSELQRLQDEVLQVTVGLNKDLRALFDVIFPRETRGLEQ
jgi:hypothetical protein